MAKERSWSPGQQEAIAKVAAWLRIKYSPFFYLAGYAGTGKTTLARHIAGLQNGKVVYAAYTGKAAKVMRASGCAGAKTIHSTIYNTETDPLTGRMTTQLDKLALDDVALVVIDEVSMVDEEVAADLLWFGKPILVLGDPFQLPPVKGAGFFTSRTPDAMLTEVHRQAADSPIIRLATDIREGRYRREEFEAEGLKITRNITTPEVLDADAVIVGRNETRRKYNRRLRELRGFIGEFPDVGESVICLWNDREKRISNGEIFRVEKVRRPSKVKGKGQKINLTISEPENDKRGPIQVSVWEHFFQDRLRDLDWRDKRQTQEFDFGQALTAHKSQGSQWPKVCVFDESSAFREAADRWLYTSVTRASSHLTLVI